MKDLGVGADVSPWVVRVGPQGRLWKEDSQEEGRASGHAVVVQCQAPPSGQWTHEEGVVFARSPLDSWHQAQGQAHNKEK